jgi:beta-lactamase regulating signal transducer with metallopeptidase domain
MILCFVWMIGVAWSLIGLMRAWHAAIRLQTGATGCDSLFEQLAAQQQLFGLRKLPRLVAVEGHGSPMLIGVLRPIIMIPKETLRRLSIAEKTMVLGHELAHIRRADLLWSLVASGVRAVFFFHPLVWWAERQLRLVQEVGADELVVARQQWRVMDYGSVLVSVVEKLGQGPLFSSLAVETAGTVHSVARRLTAMARFGQTSRRMVFGSGVLLAAVVVLGLVPWRLAATENKESDAPQSLPSTIAEKQSPEQAKAIVEIERLGGRVVADKGRPGSPVVFVQLPMQPEVTDAALKYVADLPNIEQVMFNWTSVTDKGLESLKGLNQLESLGLQGTKVRGPGLAYLRELSELKNLNLMNTEVTGPGLEHLHGLASLLLSGTKVDDDGLKYVGGLTNLRFLTLTLTNVSDVGLEHLRTMNSLESLFLGGTKISDIGLEHINGLSKLRHLDLSFTKVTDAGLERLKRLNLQILSLGPDKITDSGLRHLSGMTTLQTLELMQTEVTDVGLEHLRSIPNLKSLNLLQTKVTDAGLERLQGMTSLESLDLRGAPVTDPGVAKLQQTLPTCHILYGDVPQGPSASGNGKSFCGMAQ